MECDHVSAAEGEVHQIELFVVDHGFSVLVAVHKMLEHEPFMYGIYWLYGTCMVYLYDIMLMGTKQHSGYCLLGSLVWVISHLSRGSPAFPLRVSLALPLCMLSCAVP